jgi:hypothetical protein
LFLVVGAALLIVAAQGIRGSILALQMKATHLLPLRGTGVDVMNVHLRCLAWRTTFRIQSLKGKRCTGAGRPPAPAAAWRLPPAARQLLLKRGRGRGGNALEEDDEDDNLDDFIEEEEEEGGGEDWRKQLRAISGYDPLK